MIDFKKLMAQTPEERAAAAEESRKEFEAQMLERIQARTNQIEHMARALENHPDEFSEWEKSFILDWQLKAYVKDITGWVGGKLMDLSSNQTAQFKRLTQKANTLSGPAADTQQHSQPTNESGTEGGPTPAPARKGFRRR